MQATSTLTDPRTLHMFTIKQKATVCEKYYWLTHSPALLLTAVQSFYLVGLHARPCNCIYEMSKLETVYNWLNAGKLPNYDRVIFLGDFNAGCAYFKQGVDERKVPFLFNEHHSNIRQYITGNTNIQKTCPYDKMAVSSCMYSRDALNNANIFDFATQLFPPGNPLPLVCWIYPCTCGCTVLFLMYLFIIHTRS